MSGCGCRLPKTPGVRVPRPKERIYSISVNGSPVQSSNQDIVINVPIGNGVVGFTLEHGTHFLRALVAQDHNQLKFTFRPNK